MSTAVFSSVSQTAFYNTANVAANVIASDIANNAANAASVKTVGTYNVKATAYDDTYNAVYPVALATATATATAAAAAAIFDKSKVKWNDAKTALNNANIAVDAAKSAEYVANLDMVRAGAAVVRKDYYSPNAVNDANYTVVNNAIYVAGGGIKAAALAIHDAVYDNAETIRNTICDNAKAVYANTGDKVAYDNAIAAADKDLKDAGAYAKSIYKASEAAYTTYYDIAYKSYFDAAIAAAAAVKAATK